MPKGIYKRTSDMKTGKHMTGRKLPQKTINKLIKIRKKYYKTHKSGMYGKTQSKETKQKIKRANSGSNHYHWKGGKFKDSRGYIKIFMPSHPFCNPRGYIYEHRLVVEKIIKRYLQPSEKCHHINKIKDDNRPKNLIVFKGNAAHNEFEKTHFTSPSNVVFDGRSVSI